MPHPRASGGWNDGRDPRRVIWAIVGDASLRSVYPDFRMTLMFASIAAIALVLFFVGIRTQTAVGNVQFIKSMIPDHSGVWTGVDNGCGAQEAVH